MNNTQPQQATPKGGVQRLAVDLCGRDHGRTLITGNGEAFTIRGIRHSQDTGPDGSPQNMVQVVVDDVDSKGEPMLRFLPFDGETTLTIRGAATPKTRP